MLYLIDVPAIRMVVPAVCSGASAVVMALHLTILELGGGPYLLEGGESRGWRGGEGQRGGRRGGGEGHGL